MLLPSKREGKSVAPSKAAKEVTSMMTSANGSAADGGVGAFNISNPTCTGVLCSHLLSRNIHGDYRHGCGKSTLLSEIGCRELPIPDHIDIFHLARQTEESDLSALEALVSCDEKRLRLENEVEALVGQVLNQQNTWYFLAYILLMDQISKHSTMP